MQIYKKGDRVRFEQNELVKINFQKIPFCRFAASTVFSLYRNI